MDELSNSIYINPKFKNVHINPNFLNSTAKTIFINPAFILPQPIEPPLPAPVPQKPAPPRIIKNTLRKLIREPLEKPKVIPLIRKTSLVKVSNTKLVRASHLIKEQNKQNEIIRQSEELMKKAMERNKIEATSSSVYKLDRRYETFKKKKIIRKDTLKRFESYSTISPRKVVVNNGSKGKSDAPISSLNRKLVMLNINGVLYKSTSNKLQRSTTALPATTPQYPNERSVFVRGEKFLLDGSGTRLRRDSNADNTKMKISRIDIGGLTYKKDQSGEFERDNSHKVRSHLTSAKSRSISILANKLKKVNTICPIYRRIGKCLSYANGKCLKKHDQRYVIVCPLFLKNACENDKCLLSHNVNLSKMPVCKYFLEGLCAKPNCVYLHKKVSLTSKVCPEFIKGYCMLAEKCELRHELPTPEIRDRRRKNRPDVLKPSTSPKPIQRYYEGSEECNEENSNVPKRTKLGKLPSYIAL